MNIRDFRHSAKNESFGENLQIRRLEENDYELGFLSVLSVLTTVGTISKEKWSVQYRNITSNPLIEIWVIHDTDLNQIIGSATLLIEPKFIHACGRVGHIEDVVIRKNIHGGGFGKKLIDHLTKRAVLAGCYKVILDCSDKNVGFYEKCGFIAKGREMALYSKL
jgi:glucosamine-phosphate N-acetyltransferase